MEIWSLGWSEASSSIEAVHRCLILNDESSTGASAPVLDLRRGHDENSGVVHVHIASEVDQQRALAHVGLVE